MITICHNDQQEKANIAKDLFVKNHEIPEQLIDIINTKSCLVKKDLSLVFNINKKGELILLSYDYKKIINSLNSFKQI
jgi:protein-arginine kinase